MNFKDFILRFPDEESCQIFIKEKREKQGIKCRKCGQNRHYWRKKDKVWQCKGCKYRTSLKVGTVMENSNLEIKFWMYAFFLATHTKKSYSTCEIRRILGLSRYETVWYLMHRIRQFMSVENKKLFDYGAFDHNPCLYKTVSIRRRGKKSSLSNVTVFINPESRLSSSIRGSSDLMLLVAAVDPQTKPPISNETRRSSYRAISENRQLAYNLQKIVFNTKPNLPAWTLKMFQNLKAVLSGIHHLVPDKYLQLYIDEFNFKYNARILENPLDHLLDKVFRPLG